MSQQVDVFVVGGGPAGLAAAIAARKKGFSVTVADGAQFPIEKACGEGLMPGALEALSQLGVDLSASDGFSLRGIRFIDGAASVSADFRHGAGLGIRRTLLHGRLVAAAERAGVCLLWRTPVTGLDEQVVVAGSRAFQFRWLIGADGVQSRVAKWAGLHRISRSHPRFARQQHFRVAPWSDHVEIDWGRESQAYVTPVAENEVCIVLLSRDPCLRMQSLFDRHPELAHRLRAVRPSSAERGAVTGSVILSRLANERVLLLGDASGIVDAITGEGLRLGFEQALAAAEAMANGDLSRYARVHRSLSHRPRTMARLLLSLDVRPVLRKRLLHALAENPRLFQSLLAAHTGNARWTEKVAVGAGLGFELLFA
jgi:menaquinone-9 beta-reductase